MLTEVKRVGFIHKLLSIILIFLILLNIIFMRIRVPTGSMIGTINPGDQFFVLRDIFIRGYSRGDIVVFKRVGDSTLLVKRMIGMPGEHVVIEDGMVTINGNKLEEDYLSTFDKEYSGEFDVPEDSYLFLGDNRDDSYDARYWTHPYVNKNKLYGKVVLKTLPSIEVVRGHSYGE